jgi:glycosyltransferase involved in cell wall biosynthesis
MGRVSWKREENMVKVSVIVPMYNALKYITGCVDALLRQTICDIEVIIVNDCSTDGSMELCRERYEDDPRVVLVQQPVNMGPGQARNAGMKAASGEYLVFVDADDGLLPEALKAMYETAVQTDADVVHAKGMLVPYESPVPEDLSVLKRFQLVKLSLDRETGYDSMHMMEMDLKTRLENWMKHYYHWNVCGKLFRASFIREYGIMFTDLPLSEDYCFVFHCLLHAKNYVILPCYYYIYRICTDSFSRSEKTPAFLARTLRALFCVSEVIEQYMDEVPFFAENPEYRDRVIDYSLSILDDFYVTQAYQSVGRKAADADGMVRDVFRQHFGSNARYAAGLFYDHHDALPKADDLMEMINHTEYWENALANGKVHLLEEDS